MTSPTAQKPHRSSFASDNYSGAHPRVLEAIALANDGHDRAYGSDRHTAQLQELVQHHFGAQAVGYPVFTGTGANVIGLQSMQSRWGAVICAANAHINTDENGAPERVGGMKLLPVETPDGKLTPELIAREAWGWGEEHRAQPEVVSITQSTELGTVYSLDELKEISEYVHGLGLKLHIDGARLSNAAVALGCSLAETTTEIGADVVSWGGTKNGLLFGEVIVAINPDAVSGVGYLRKLNMQQSSKTRFISAQFLELYGTELWRENARAANAAAGLLRSLLDDAIVRGEAPGLSFAQTTEANAIFAVLPREVSARLQREFQFYDWDDHGQVRWMTSFDTSEQDVKDFATAIIRELAR